MTRTAFTAGLVAAAAFLLPLAHPVTMAQGNAALTGTITSMEEGKMEGVVVSARRDGATFTVSVVSDEKGTYRFPRTPLDPGPYTITVRAVGFDLIDPGPVQVGTGKAATADLKLARTKDLAAQLTSAEWATSMNGTPEQKEKFN